MVERRGAKTIAKRKAPTVAEGVDVAVDDAERMGIVPHIDQLLPMFDLGTRINLARRRLGWTQRELSERVGKSRATIVQYELGKLQPPLHQIEVMAKVLDVAPELLAFGRQGITGLAIGVAHVASLAEIELGAGGETITGGYGLPDRLVIDFGIDPEMARVYILSHAAPSFGYEARDRIIVNPDEAFSEEHKLYALQARGGVEVVKLLPNLSSRNEAVKLNDGNGQTHSYERDELTVLGLIVGSIRAR